MYEIKEKYTSAKIFTENEDIEVTEQTRAVCNHPIFKDCEIRIMPDCHKGKGCTIGFTAEMPKNGEIIPNIIGVDQFCGMHVIKLSDNDITNDYEKLDKVIRRNIPFGREGRRKFSELVPEEFIEKTKKICKDILKDNFVNHVNKIGSLGGGNHFISLEKGSTGTYLIIHSGSRNIGLKLAIHYQDLAITKNCYGEGELKQLSFLTDKDAQDYLTCAEYCREYGKRWIATYGQSEGTARMAYLPPEWAISKVGSIGRAVPNGELSLIDSEGNPVSTPYTEGEMCYRGKNVTLGYAYKKEDLSLGDERHGFMRTGDLAYFDEDHCFYIVGRMGRFLKLFGMRIGLDECEQIIKAKYSVDCACVGTDDKMIVYITNSTLEKGVKEELVDKTHLVASAFEVRYLSELPRSGAGKILYSQLSNK